MRAPVWGRCGGNGRGSASGGGLRAGQDDRLDELEVDAKGVNFKAKAALALEPLAAMPEKPKVFPRSFWFDRPFFLFLWRDGAEWPYAGVWFGDADGLVKE